MKHEKGGWLRNGLGIWRPRKKPTKILPGVSGSRQLGHASTNSFALRRSYTSSRAVPGRGARRGS